MDTDISGHEDKLLLNKSFIEVSLDERHRVIVAKWKGTLSLEQVQEGCQFMTTFIREHSLRHHLSDHTSLESLAPEVQEYLINEWFFEVEKEGLQKVAVRLAKNIFAQATVRRVNRVEKYGELEIETFPSYESAYAWLLA